MNDRDRARNKARYERLKSLRQCVTCTSPLDSDDGVKCVVCADQSRLATLRRNARNRASYNKRKRKQMRAAYRRDIDANRARLRAIRLDKKLRGECYNCTDPSAADSIWCPYHQAKHRRYAMEHWRRRHPGYQPRKQPPAVPARQPKRRVAAPVIDLGRARDAVRDYVMYDNDGYRIRLLRVLRWDDWLNSRELFDRAGIDADYMSTDRANAAQALTRMVRAGFVEARAGSGLAGHGGKWRDYKITAAGRAELDEITGDNRRRERRVGVAF